MKKYKQIKGQIHGQQNSRQIYESLRKRENHEEIRKSKSAARYQSRDDKQSSDDNKFRTWEFILFLAIILPGIFVSARMLRRELNANKKVNDNDGHVDEHSFVKVKVENPCEFSLGDSNVFLPHDIDVITNNAIQPQELPYHDAAILDAKINTKLSEYGIQRDLHTRMVLRGDKRGGKTIFEAGGFFPRCAKSNQSPLPASCSLDVVRHRDGALDTSGFVSTTVSQEVAHRFGWGHWGSAYAVYTMLVTGAVTPSSNIGLFSDEKEYSVPGGIENKDILAYRECNANMRSTCSDIQLNSLFAKNHPEMVSEVVRTQLLCDEKVKP